MGLQPLPPGSRPAAGSATAGRTVRPVGGSAVSARWRIVGWIVLTTALALLALLVTVRSLLIAGVDRDANDDVVQEAQEFTTFAAEAVDPLTAQPYSSVSELLDSERRRYTELLDSLQISPEAPERLRKAARKVDDLRFAAARPAAVPQPESEWVSESGDPSL